VADADVAAQWMDRQQLGEAAELALGAAAVDPPLVDRGNPGAVIAAILEPLQRLEQKVGDRLLRYGAHDTAHASTPRHRDGSRAIDRALPAASPAVNRDVPEHGNRDATVDLTRRLDRPSPRTHPAVSSSTKASLHRHRRFSAESLPPIG
jgi:hypothetical protein